MSTSNASIADIENVDRQSIRHTSTSSKIIISADERFAARLTVDHPQFIIDIWDLTDTAVKDVAFESIPSLLKATGTFPIPHYSSEAWLGLTISADGSTLAVFEIPTDQEKWEAETELRRGNFPCRFFKCDYTFTPVEIRETVASVTSPNQITEVNLAPKLKSFIGFARLQKKAPGLPISSADQEHVFVACDGLSIAVYDLQAPNRSDSCIYSLSLQEISVRSTAVICGVKVPRRDACKLLMESMHDSLFLWSNGLGISSVWNWRNGSLRSYLHIAPFNLRASVYEPRGRHACFSRDGSVVVFSELQLLFAFFTDSGLTIGMQQLDGKVEELQCLDDYRIFAVINSSIKVFDVANMATWIDETSTSQATSPCEGACTFPALSHSTTERRLDLLCLSPISGQDIPTQMREESRPFIPMNTSGSAEWGYNFVLDRNLSMEEISLRVYQYGGVDSHSEVDEIEVFSQTFFYHCEPEVVVLLRKRRFAVRFEFGVCLWQLPSTRGGSFTLLSFEPSDDPQLWLEKEVGALEMESAARKMENAALKELTAVLESANPILATDLNMTQLEAQLEALRNELHRLKNDDDIEYPLLCSHGKILKWPRNDLRPAITLDVSRSCYFGNQETLKCIKFIPFVLKYFLEGEAMFAATQQYLMRHINRYPDHSDSINNSVIGAFVKHCEVDGCERLFRDILEDIKMSWVPHASLFSRDPEKDIFGILSNHSQRAMIQSLAEYMLRSARNGNKIEPNGNSGYLNFLLESLPHIAEKDPSTTLWITRQAAFLPSDYRRMCLVQDAVLNNPPRQQSFLWKNISGGVERFQEFKNELCEYPNPIFQVQSQLPMTIGPLNLSPAPKCFPKARENDSLNKQIKLDFYMAPVSLAFSVQAIGADTNRFGRVFWILRFIFQIIYYILVITVSFYQINLPTGDYSDDGQFVYNKAGSVLRGQFIAILVMGLIFLYLELKHARGNWRRCFTVYNALDLFVYLLPMVVSTIQLVIPREIFELRVYKNICQVATIITSILVNVPSFFFILAVFVLAFAHSLLYLTQTNYQSICPKPSNGNYPEACTDAEPAFPSQYFDAVTTTYFFIAGQYTALADSMGQGQVSVQAMAALFVFLTVILMLNVVIALMNEHHDTGAARGLFVWLRSRIEVLARIENLYYAIPNYRLQRDHFPRYIFYTATEEQVRLFAEKYDRPELLERFHKTAVKSSAADVETVETANIALTDVESLKRAIQ
ncbi:hypothetical protein BGZ58_005314 [Dissophora ornata]|nr:hypothetical protein BGZ58_005314 [Dissophora ornata]